MAIVCICMFIMYEKKILSPNLFFNTLIWSDYWTIKNKKIHLFYCLYLKHWPWRPLDLLVLRRTKHLRLVPPLELVILGIRPPSFGGQINQKCQAVVAIFINLYRCSVYETFINIKLFQKSCHNVADSFLKQFFGDWLVLLFVFFS